MTTLDWAISIKPQLVELQKRTGIPALAAAAQFCQESASDSAEGLSTLASVYHNYAGLKWVANWQADMGCSPTPPMGTWEEQSGQAVNQDAVFCCCHDFDHWLGVYSALLTGSYYGSCLEFKDDPMLFMCAVWRKGWATDSRYLSGVSMWMAMLYDDYRDTVPPAEPRRPVPILDSAGKVLATGWLDGDKTAVHLRQLGESLGLTVEWGDGKVILHFPGADAK